MTGPPRSAVRRPPGRQALKGYDDTDVVTDLLIRSLARAQLALGLRLAAVVGLLLGGLPLLFAAVPRTGRISVLGLPLPWLLLGVLVYPTVFAAAWLYVRLAERNELDFVELVEQT